MCKATIDSDFCAVGVNHRPSRGQCPSLFNSVTSTALCDVELVLYEVTNLNKSPISIKNYQLIISSLECVKIANCLLGDLQIVYLFCIMTLGTSGSSRFNRTWGTAGNQGGLGTRWTPRAKGQGWLPSEWWKYWFVVLFSNVPNNCVSCLLIFSFGTFIHWNCENQW